MLNTLAPEKYHNKSHWWEAGERIHVYIQFQLASHFHLLHITQAAYPRNVYYVLHVTNINWTVLLYAPVMSHPGCHACGICADVADEARYNPCDTDHTERPFCLCETISRVWRLIEMIKTWHIIWLFTVYITYTSAAKEQKKAWNWSTHRAKLLFKVVE